MQALHDFDATHECVATRWDLHIIQTVPMIAFVTSPLVISPTVDPTGKHLQRPDPNRPNQTLKIPHTWTCLLTGTPSGLRSGTLIGGHDPAHTVGCCFSHTFRSPS